MVNCDKCNYAIKYRDKFCRNCGEKLSEALIEEIIFEYESIETENESLLDQNITGEETELEKFEVEEKAIGYENLVTEAYKIDKLNYIKNIRYNQKLNFKDIVSKDEYKVILLLILTISLFISAIIAKNTIFSSKESYGVKDNLIIAAEGENVYYTNIYDQLSASSSESSKISTYKIRGSNADKLFDGFAAFLNVKNNWLYYIRNDDIQGIYKIKTDGTEKQMLLNGSAMNLKVQGNFIYYMPYKDIAFCGELYRMNLNGTVQAKISSDVLIYQIIGNSIYYSSYNELGAVYKMNLDGSNKIKLCTLGGSILYVKDGYLYYRIHEGSTAYFDSMNSSAVNANEEQKKIAFLYSDGYLYRTKFDGSGKELLIKNNAFNIVFYNNFIIYYDPVKGYNRLDLNGKNEVKIIGQTFVNPQISIINNYIYYYNAKDKKLYKKSLDSKESVPINITSK